MIYWAQIPVIECNPVRRGGIMRRFNGWMDVDKLGDDRVRRGEEPPPSYFLAGGEVRCLYM